MVRKAPEDWLPLSPAVFHILLALADGEMHGPPGVQGVGTHITGTQLIRRGDSLSTPGRQRRPKEALRVLDKLDAPFASNQK